MTALKIIPDSGCDLSEEMMRGLGSEPKIPFFLQISGESIPDDDALSVDALLAKMAACSGRMSSACASPETWREAFIKAGGGLGITISAKLSGMNQSAKIGLTLAKAELPGLVGHVFDTKSAACGEVLVAMKIRQYAEAGLDFDEIIVKTEKFIDEMETYFILDDISNLIKNGRVHKITGALVNVLGIKPVLGARDGEIDLCGKVRGSANVEQKLLDTIGESKRNLKGEDLVITHCNNAVLAVSLAKRAKERFGFSRVTILPTGGIASFYACNKGIIISF